MFIRATDIIVIILIVNRIFIIIKHINKLIIGHLILRITHIVHNIKIPHLILPIVISLIINIHSIDDLRGGVVIAYHLEGKLLHFGVGRTTVVGLGVLAVLLLL